MGLALLPLMQMGLTREDHWALVCIRSTPGTTPASLGHTPSCVSPTPSPCLGGEREICTEQLQSPHSCHC